MKIRNAIAWSLLSAALWTSVLQAQPPAVPLYVPQTSILNPSPRGLESPALRNAFEDPPEPSPFPSWGIGYDQMLMWIQRPTYPALVTTGSVNDTSPGALDQPNTRVLLGGTIDNASAAQAGRLSGWYAPGGQSLWSVDANYYLMEQRSNVVYNASDSNGFPLIARPYYDITTGAESADLRAFPGALSGTLHDSFSSRLQGAEANVRFSLTGTNPNDGVVVNLLFGPRWVNFNERYQTYDQFDPIPAVPNGTTSISDNIAAQNNVVAGQVGLQVRSVWDRLSFDMFGKFFGGVNFETARLSGESRAFDAATGLLIVAPQGLFVQSSNAGTYVRNQSTYGFDAGLGMGVDVSERLSLKLGYNFSYLADVLRPQNLIDRNVNIQPIGPPGSQTAPFGPLPPELRQQSMWIQSLSLGVALRF